MLSRLAFAILLPVYAGLAQTARFKTNAGDIDVTLLPQSAPRSVQNFLNYVNRGAYANSIFHRSVAGFVIQGGGFKWNGTTIVEIPADPPVRNEYQVSNTRGTISMAKLGSGPDTATNQWFFNLGDNSANLKNQNGGFTVFGRVADQASLAVMDKIGTLPVLDFGSPFDTIPLQSFSGSLQEKDLVIVTSIQVLGSASIRGEDGVLGTADYGGYKYAAAGSYIEVRGSNLTNTTRAWASSDFVRGSAPTSLDGIGVRVQGEACYVSYISPELIVAQVPTTILPGGSASVVVSSRGQAQAQSSIQLRKIAPGLFAPPELKVDDKQYVSAKRADGSTVSIGNKGDSPATPVQAGETLTFMGTGFGAVTNEDIPIAGELAAKDAPLVATVEFKIGGVVAPVKFAGLTAGMVGMYRFEVTVPEGIEPGDRQVEVMVGDEAVPQTLWLPVK